MSSLGHYQMPKNLADEHLKCVCGDLCGQAAAELSVSLERSKWRTGRRMNVPYLSTSLVWQMWVLVRESLGHLSQKGMQMG